MEKKCGFSECLRRHDSHGLCKSHAKQLRNGKPLSTLPVRASSKEDFFRMRIEKTDTCWLWTGKKTSLGYGQIKFNGHTELAHRYSWELANNLKLNEKYIDHLCHVTLCVRPDHLRSASPKQNSENRSGAAKSSQSGVRGVYWDSEKRLWRADVRHNGRTILIGRFSDINDAEFAAAAKRKELFSVTG